MVVVDGNKKKNKKASKLNCSVVKLIGILFYDDDHEIKSIQRQSSVQFDIA
jgi:predicted oxidoreductase (fatty acid repression mutant protein)